MKAVSGVRPHILLLGDTLQVGGMEGQLVEVATRLDRSRWNLHVACVRALGPLRTRLEAAGVRPWSCGPRSFKSPGLVLAIYRLARDLRARRIHLLHAFDMYSNILGVLAARLAGVRAVIASQRELPALRQGLERLAQRVVLPLASHVLVNSEAIAEDLSRLRVARPRRIVVIPNGVDLARFRPMPTRQHSPNGRMVVGTLANLRPEKAIQDLLRAAVLVRQRCPDARCAVWGDGPSRAELERLVDALGLGGVVELRGPTGAPEVALRELGIFVLPSLSEGCPNVLLEAMATGLPVVATNVGGSAGVVQDQETGLLVPPGDPAQLAQAIVRLIEDPAQAAHLARQARRRVHSDFSIERMVDRIQALYERALAGDC